MQNRYNFIAVYAGKTKYEATKILKILEQVNTAGFTDASLRKMQVIADTDY